MTIWHTPTVHNTMQDPVSVAPVCVTGRNQTETGMKDVSVVLFVGYTFSYMFLSKTYQ
jgi:hypothetical protein